MKVDLVLPRGNEKEFIKTAEKLGYGGICFLYPLSKSKDNEKKQSPLKGKTRLKIFFGKILSQKDVKKTFNYSDLVVARSSSEDRFVFEKGKMDVMYDLETKPRKDFVHHRNSGLNQVLCKLAKKNKLVIGFSFSTLLTSKENLKSSLLGRLKQNISLCRKYKLETLLASFAKKPYHMRSSSDLLSLGISLGMHPSEAQKSLENTHKRILLNQKKRKNEFICEGVELVT